MSIPERMARVEAQVEGLRSDISELKVSVGSVDTKIDGLALEFAAKNRLPDGLSQKLDDLAVAIASQSRLPEPAPVPSTPIIPPGKGKYMAAIPFIVALIYSLYETFSNGGVVGE